MMCFKHSCKTFAALCLLVLTVTNCVNASIQFSQSVSVVAVYDGVSFSLGSGTMVRLVSLDTAQAGQPGFSEAKNYLENMVLGKTVYLDVANTTNVNGQVTLVCLVYVDYNSTSYENVNMAMLVSNYAFPNNTLGGEFSPSSWNLLNPKDNPTASPTISIPSPSESPQVTQYTAPSPPVSTPSIPELTMPLIFGFMLSAMFIVVIKSCSQKEKR
jgi:hypothetical protein